MRAAQASGIELRLVDGKVKAIGPREAVARLIEPLRQHRAALADALQAEQVESWPVDAPDDPVTPMDWHALDAAYNAHHFNCPTCIAAGRGTRYGLRCGTFSYRVLAYPDTDFHRAVCTPSRAHDPRLRGNDGSNGFSRMIGGLTQ